MKRILPVTLLFVALALTACTPRDIEPTLPPRATDAAPPPTATSPASPATEPAPLPESSATEPSPIAPPTQETLPTPTSAEAQIPDSESPLATPTPATPSPSVFTPTTYEEPVAGFAIDYPSDWRRSDVSEDIRRESFAYSVTFYSGPEGAGGEGLPPGSTSIDVTVLNNDAGSFDDVAVQRREEITNGELPATIVSETPYALPSGLPAMRWEIDTPNGRVIEVASYLNGRTLLVTGNGDLTLFDAIARTLRPLT